MASFSQRGFEMLFLEYMPLRIGTMYISEQIIQAFSVKMSE